MLIRMMAVVMKALVWDTGQQVNVPCTDALVGWAAQGDDRRLVENGWVAGDGPQTVLDGGGGSLAAACGPCVMGGAWRIFDHSDADGDDGDDDDDGRWVMVGW